VINAVLARLSPEAADLIERQLATRARVSRIIDDEDVMLYPARGSTRDPAVAFVNQSLDLRLATVRIRGPRGTGKVTLSAVDGWLFMLEFRPGPRKVGSTGDIEVVDATIHVDPMAPDVASSRLVELDMSVRIELDRVHRRRPAWATTLALPGEMYTINLDDGVFLVLAQLPDTDFVVARVDPAGPGIRRYDTDGDLVGEYDSIQAAVEGETGYEQPRADP